MCCEQACKWQTDAAHGWWQTVPLGVPFGEADSCGPKEPASRGGPDLPCVWAFWQSNILGYPCRHQPSRDNCWYRGNNYAAMRSFGPITVFTISGLTRSSGRLDKYPSRVLPTHLRPSPPSSLLDYCGTLLLYLLFALSSYTVVFCRP